jgi:hypothetical protein
MLLAYQREQTLKACFDKCTGCSTFDDAWNWVKETWNLLREKSTLLRDFAGGLSTVFPSTAAVESDFSLIKWGKDEFRSALTDCFLQGTLHCIEYKAVLKHKTEYIGNFKYA